MDRMNRVKKREGIGRGYLTIEFPSPRPLSWRAQRASSPDSHAPPAKLFFRHHPVHPCSRLPASPCPPTTKWPNNFSRSSASGSGRLKTKRSGSTSALCPRKEQTHEPPNSATACHPGCKNRSALRPRRFSTHARHPSASSPPTTPPESQGPSPRKRTDFDKPENGWPNKQQPGHSDRLSTTAQADRTTGPGPRRPPRTPRRGGGGPRRVAGRARFGCGLVADVQGQTPRAVLSTRLP
jgi:hypothetical protein